MTSSIESSAGSASENKPQLAFGGQFLGMDEAGYGPNLGPLIVTVTSWGTPDRPFDCDFYGMLNEAVSRIACKRSSTLHVADSKEVNSGSKGFRNLETAALALLRCAGCETDSFTSLYNFLSNGLDATELPVWYHGELPLPLIASDFDVKVLSERLADCLNRKRIGLQSLRSDIVTEERFNRLTSAFGTKGMALSRITFDLLRTIWNPECEAETVCIGDKHGGRNRYDDLIAEVLDGQMIFRMEESRALSRYRVGATDLLFQAKGENHFPVATASIISKYMRELSMELLNRFWAQHCPGVRPTKGYPSDAKRFAADVLDARTQLGIRDELFWRTR